MDDPALSCASCLKHRRVLKNAGAWGRAQAISAKTRVATANGASYSIPRHSDHNNVSGYLLAEKGKRTLPRLVVIDDWCRTILAQYPAAFLSIPFPHPAATALASDALELLERMV